MAPEQNVLTRFSEIVRDYPEHGAVLENGDTLTTYKTLYQQALQIAAYLRHHCENDRVAISIDKSARYLAVLLGAWFAGKAFVPLDKNLPATRREFILNDAEIGLVMTDERYFEALSSFDALEVAVELPENHPAYIIYTSGTTGTPKGVLVSHNGIVNLADGQRTAFNMHPDARYLFYLSTNFDASISDIVVSLLSGAMLVIESQAAVSLAGNLMALIRQRGITHMDIPPSLLKLLNSEDAPDSLETVIIGGEACDIETVRKWARKVNLVNVYGPTEATVCTSLCRCTESWDKPLIGQEIANIDYHIFNSNQVVCEAGVAGELYISGIGLALGYINQPELTQEKFIELAGKRYYRTGDKVVRLQDGAIQFLGRMDRQVKVHGQLVELEEVEACLNAQRLVRRAAVLKRPLVVGGSEKLVAFVELKSPDERDALCEIKAAVSDSLPAWMVPSHIELLDAMPLTDTGKVNQAVLAEYGLRFEAVGEEALSEDEQLIVAIFKHITKMPAVSPDDSFFELGGDSLGAVEFVLECANRGFNVSADLLLVGETPRAIARELRQRQSARMEVADLLPDVVVDADLTSGLVDNKKVTDVLITGCTGFLGVALLKELLLTTDYRIYCLVRADDERAGLNRIRQTFSEYNLDLNEGEEARLQVIIGDVGQACLGMEPQAYAWLAETIDRVYHCAAVVNMIYPYNALKQANLEGVKQVLQFCCTGRRKPLHYASTLSVFVSSDRHSGVAYEADRLDETTVVYGGYAQTKFAAEKYLLAIPQSICDVFIYRLGLITGSTQTAIPAKRDFLGMFVQGAQSLRTMPADPSESLAVDITPVDYAARCMAEIAVSETEARIFHIANPEPLKYTDLLRLMQQQGLVQEVLSYEDWCDELASKSALSTREQLCLMALCRLNPARFEQQRTMDLFQATGIRFDRRHVEAIVSTACPPADDALIRRYLQAMSQVAAHG